MKHDMSKKLSRHFNIDIADLVIEINTVSLSTSLFCYDFICESKPDLSIYVTEQDVEHEKRIDTTKNNNKRNNGFYEALAAYRKIADAVIPLDRFLIHGAAIAIGNKAVLFTAPSRTGKTTHIRLWLRNVHGAYVINGDKPLIRITDKQAIVCGTPWAGSEQYYTDAQIPLSVVVFMERNETNEIKEISFKDAYPLLLQQTYMPNDATKAKLVLNMLNMLDGRVSFFKFRFNNYEEDCFQVASNTIMEKLHEQS